MHVNACQRGSNRPGRHPHHETPRPEHPSVRFVRFVRFVGRRRSTGRRPALASSGLPPVPPRRCQLRRAGGAAVGGHRARPGERAAGLLPPLLWHAHGMLVGFATAAIVEFLLTVGRAWTGLATPRGAGLGALAMLWLAARGGGGGAPPGPCRARPVAAAAGGRVAGCRAAARRQPAQPASLTSPRLDGKGG